MKGKIKKYVALVLSVQQLLCGCSATELEDRCFPMMAVVDEKDGQISFGYGFPKLSQKDNTDLEEARVNIAPVTGKTMESCVQTYDSRLEKLADCNHMKVLVFGENLMEDTGRYADVLSYLKQTGLFQETSMYVWRKIHWHCLRQKKICHRIWEVIWNSICRIRNQRDQENCLSLAGCGREGKPYPADYAAISGNRRPYHLLENHVPRTG